jgi:mannose-6-phosphate isomerase-like protein (cupin superfamily)
MSMKMSVLRNVKREDIPQDFENGFAKGEMLPGTYPGVATYKCTLKAGSNVAPKVYTDKTQIFFFTKGTGYIATPKKAYNITEAAVYIPMFDAEGFSIQAATDLEYLELLVDITEDDKKKLHHSRMTLPHFRLLTDCDRYEEGFKSEGILSYIIVTRGRLARILMGLVSGDGPDYVGEHSHETVMQWFYGMDGTKFEFTASGETITVEDGDWVYIPEKTLHSATTAAGEKINYVWFEVDCD